MLKKGHHHDRVIFLHPKFTLRLKFFNNLVANTKMSMAHSPNLRPKIAISCKTDPSYKFPHIIQSAQYNRHYTDYKCNKCEHKWTRLFIICWFTWTSHQSLILIIMQVPGRETSVSTLILLAPSHALFCQKRIGQVNGQFTLPAILKNA